MPLEKNTTGAIFDIKPTKRAVNFGVERSKDFDETINLREDKTPEIPQSLSTDSFFENEETTATLTSVESIPELPEVILPKQKSVADELDEIFNTPAIQIPKEKIDPPTEAVPTPVEEKPEAPENFLPRQVQKAPTVVPGRPATVKQTMIGQLEEMISSPINIHAELAQFGVRIHEPKPKTPAKIEAEPVMVQEPVVELASVGFNEPVRPSETLRQDYAKSVRDETRDFWHRKHLHSPPAIRKFIFKRGAFSSKWLVLAAAIVATGAFASFQGGNHIKNNIVENGKNAVENVMTAKQQLEQLKFTEAANSFVLAYDDFSKANNTLDKFGASFSSVLKYIPGLNKISSATNIVLAGENMSKVGEEMALFLAQASKIKLATLLNPVNGEGQSFYELFKNLRTVVLDSQSRVQKTQKLLGDISKGVLPEDKQQLFDLFKDKLPQLSGLLDQSVKYSDFLVGLVPEKGVRKYLFLFQNNSELRATGGFPGSYGVISFENGRFTGIKIDDVYNPDGQLKNNIIPPKPLQHITPTWGARDANWFADFPTSAKKIIDFYHEGSGESVDGVITLTPDIMLDILKLTGPIDMPEYNLTLGADNFMAQVQSEVEYGDHKTGESPKTILFDFFPRFVEKIGQQNQDNLLKIATIFSDALEQKRILAYFNDDKLESKILDSNFGGALEHEARDYMQVVFTNVKGSKTDAMTDSSLDLSVNINADKSVEHELKITRTHNGGDKNQRFYNLQNPDYIRVYAPANAELEFIDGNDNPEFVPLVDYKDGTYKTDEDLGNIESGTSHPYAGVDVFKESGKKVFGFWMVLDPKDTKTIILRYKVPSAYSGNDYHLFIQKQSGTLGDPLQASFELPSGKSVANSSPQDLQVNGNSLILNTDLRLDRDIKIQLK